MYCGLPSASSAFAFKSNPTLAAGDAKVSIDGGALANLATLPAVTPASSKMVKISLSTSEMNGDNITLVLSDQTSPPEWADVVINIQTAARQIDDLAFPNTSGRGMDVDASGGVEVGSFQANAITAAAIASDAGTEIGTAVWATATRVLTANTNLNDLTAAAVAAAVMASNVEGTVTLTESMRLQNSALLGKASGLGTSTAVFRDLADTKDRISATVDADGNRSAVTLDDT